MSQKQTFGSTNTGFGLGFEATANTSTTGGLFGSTPSTSSGLFGQENDSIGEGLYGNTTAGDYGQQQATGTAVVKYNPVTSTDVVVDAGTSTKVNIKHHCITCMKEYKSKSLEELRLDDYVVGRKGVFWFHYKENKPLFGGTTNTMSFGGCTHTNTKSMGQFGANKPNLGATPTPVTGLFAATTTQAPAFDTNTATFGFETNTKNQTGGLDNNELAASTGFGSFSSELFTKTNTTAPTFATTTPGTGLSASFQIKPTNPGFGTLGTTGSPFQQPAPNTVKTEISVRRLRRV